MENRQYNLTEGSILKKLLLLALPIMGTQCVTFAYNLTDMFWLGRVGSGAVAASGVAGMYMWLSVGFLLIGRMGAEIGVAQSLGRGDKQTALDYSRNSMLIALILGLLFGLTEIFANKPLIGFFNFREEEVAKDAADYLRIIGFAMPLFFVSSVVGGSYTASGNSRTPFIINSIGLAFNMILDPLFIIVLGMGIRGAAIATTISQLVTSALMIAAIFFFKARPFERYSLIFKPALDKIAQLLRWAVPIGVESLLYCFLSMLCTRVEVTFGANAIAVSRVGSQMEALTWLVGAGFGSAVVAFVGQNYGAKKFERIHKGVRISLISMTFWGSFVTLFLVFLGPSVFSLFLPDSELADMGRMYLYILAFCQLPMNLEAVGSGTFKGLGKTVTPTIVSVTGNALKPILAVVLSRTSLGIYGVWISVSLTSIIRGVWICVWYKAIEGKISGSSR